MPYVNYMTRSDQSKFACCEHPRIFPSYFVLHISFLLDSSASPCSLSSRDPPILTDLLMASSIPQDVLDRFSSLLGDTAQPPPIPIPQSSLLQEDHLAFYLVFKILTAKHLDLPTLEERLPPLWSCPSPPPRISEYHGNDVFLAKFDSKSDVDRVIEGAPWLLEGGLVSVQRCRPCTLPSAYPFHLSPFWVQLHGLPVDLLTPDVAVLLANRIGSVPSPSSEESENWSEFIRVRVEIDVSKPLTRSLRLALPSDETITVQVRYEDLPDCCRLCGCIGHDSEADCRALKDLKAAIAQALPDRSEGDAFLRSRISQLECKEPPRAHPYSLPRPDSSAVATATDIIEAACEIREEPDVGSSADVCLNRAPQVAPRMQVAPGMVKLVLRLSMEDEKKRFYVSFRFWKKFTHEDRAIKMVGGMPGVVHAEVSDQSLVVVGDGGMDLVAIVRKFRMRMGYAQIVSVGPAAAAAANPRELFVDIELYNTLR